MTCGFDKERLTGYYDGELEAADKAEIENHISACSECLRELGDVKSAATLVRELPRARAPASIAEGVSRELAAAARSRRFSRIRGGLLAAASAAAVMLCVGTYFRLTEEREAAPAAAARPVPPSSELAWRGDRMKENGAAPQDEAQAGKPAPDAGPSGKAGAALEGRPSEEQAKVGRTAEADRTAAGAPQPPAPGGGAPLPKGPAGEPAPAEAKPVAPAKERLVIASTEIATARSRVINVLSSLSVPVDYRMDDQDRQGPISGAFLAVELTEAELAELKKRLRSETALVLREAADAKKLQDGAAAQRVGFAARGAEEKKKEESAARPAPSPPASKEAAKAELLKDAPAAGGRKEAEDKEYRLRESRRALQGPLRKVILYFEQLPKQP